MPDQTDIVERFAASTSTGVTGLRTTPAPARSLAAAPEIPAGAGFEAKDWQIIAQVGGGDLLAKKDWIASNASIGLTEPGNLTLRHTPG